MNTIAPDYQFFDLVNGKVTNIKGRLEKKLKNIPLPDLKGKTLLDVGTDFGFWCFYGNEKGARCIGLDRNRHIKGQYTDLIQRNKKAAQGTNIEFHHCDIGKQWKEFGYFDVVLCFSVYHHIYANCLDHNSVFYWLWRHTKGVLLWENPVDNTDPVVNKNVPGKFDPDELLKAAETYFETEYIGLGHVNTRHVYRMTPRPYSYFCNGRVVSGSGGASKAFQYKDERRMDEIEQILGIRPFPGSLNIRLGQDFDWDRNYYRAQVLDATDRKNINKDWGPRWARFYPVNLNKEKAWLFRFEGEKYPLNFAEAISDKRLRDSIDGDVCLRSGAGMYLIK